MQRNCSFTLCKTFIKEVFNKYNDVRNINFEIINVSDDFIKTNINIDGKINTYDIILNKKKKNVLQKSKDNLKKQSMGNNKNKDEILDSLYNNTKIDENEKSNIKEYVNKVNDSIPKNENNNIYKINMDNNNNIKNKNKSNDLFIENKKLDKNNINQNDEKKSKIFDNNGIEYDDSEPEDWYDYNDPYYKKNPEVFKCENCYQTNIDKDELFDVAQEYIDKYNLVNEENNLLKKEIKTKNKQLNIIINENNKLKDLYKNQISNDIIYEINDKFTDLVKICHKSFNHNNKVLSILEKTPPKKVPEIVNKNISIYRKEIENIADEADKIRNEFLDLNKGYMESFKIDE